MAMELAYLNLLIPIENIEKHYPGGFDQYKKDNEVDMKRKDYCEAKMRHDNYLVVKSAMCMEDIESFAKECEDFGLVGVVEKDGIEQWQDFCVVEGEPTLPCDWLLQSGAYVYHVNDKEQIPSENV